MTRAAMARLLVTRPAAQAAEWVARLAGRGLDAAALPLIAIEPPAEPQARAALHAAWMGLPARALVVFVSPNAVTQFFAQRPSGVDWPPGLPAGSPGPGSSAALRAAGLDDAAILEPPADAPRFDSESLWAVLQRRRDWRGAAVLVVRGGDGGDDDASGSGREWLADTLRAAGASVDFVRAYRRTAPRLDATQRAVWQQALAEPQAHCWLFSSSEAIAQLETLARGEASAPDWRAATALATHPRIAERARAAGFGRVFATAPTLDAIVATMQTVAGPHR